MDVLSFRSGESPSFSALGPWLRACVASADALAKLHQSGIIHQNIRPQTLRIDPKGTVELTEAELGQQDAPSALAVAYEALPYIAPEQTGRLEGALDHRADLYSLGILLYELRAGTLPFHADDALGWMHCHLARAPRPLVESAPGTPQVVSDIVMKLLEKSPDERYQSARGLLHDLERCLAELTENGHIEPFPLGARDVWDKLRAATQVFGRSAELETLRAAFERVRKEGTVEVVLVTGPSGIGKSVLMRELGRATSKEHASFLWGSFEEKKRDIPYAALGQALQDLIRKTVASSDAELSAIREQLLGALGGNGQLIVDLVPQLELVIGEQPPVPPLPATEARTRFHMVFRNFLDVFATRDAPLVFCLDNVQWADSASLEVLQQVLAHRNSRSLFILGGYRDDEVDASHPFATVLDEVRSAGVRVSSLHLEPLSQDDLVELVVDLFRCEREQAKPLAALLWAKTRGNPFFAVQLLGTLHLEQLIHFDARSWTWRWDIAELEAKEITEDMVDLVLGRLQRLPEETLQLLKLAACIGSEFSVQLLATLSAKTPEQVRSALEPALLEGLLLHRSQGYKFLHDRVLQTTYSLIPEDERSELHLRFGWLLVLRTAEAALDGILFDIVNQLNLGIARIQEADEQRRIAVFNLRAGQKAKAASAARAAANYLTTGVSLLASNAWEADYSLAFSLHLELAECEYLNGRFDEVERLCAVLAEHAQTRVERAAVYRLRIQVATAQVDNTRAVDLGLSCLRLLGLALPRDPSDDDVLAEITWLREKLHEQSIESLIDLPTMHDPQIVAMMEILSSLYPAAIYTLPNLGHVVIARMVRLSILHGNAPASVHGYVTLGNILCSRLGAFPEGFRFGKLAEELGKRPGFGSYNAEVQVIFGSLILPWSRPARESLDHFRAGFRAGQESGKLIYASSALIQNVLTLMGTGEPLEAVLEAILPALEFVRSAKYDYVADCFIWIQRCIHTLRGATERLGVLDGDEFDEAAFEEHLVSRNIPLIRLWCCIFKLQVCFLAGDMQRAYAAAKEAMELLWSGLYVLIEADLFHFAGLVAAALYDGAGEEERESLREMFSTAESKLERWAESSPDNFGAKHALVAAEIARVDKRDHDAMKLYDKAIRASQKNGFVQDEAIACELAMHFYIDRAFAILPEAYLRQTRASFERWGATAKVRQLEQSHEHLLVEPRRESGPTLRAEAEPIDTLTAAKASAAISSEMAPSELLATLMRILIEHAGAQRACLLLPSPEGLDVAAEIASEHDGVRVDIPKERRTMAATAFPLSIAHYVRRTRQKLILDDISAIATFSTDVYIADVHPKSMLCAPIVRRGEVAGILYLENRLVRGAFTPRRLALLEFLSAVSLENALLASDLARETAERAQAEKTLQKSEERLQWLVETANVVPWEADRATGRFTYVGPQVVKMLGYPQDAWLASDFLSEHVHPADRESTLHHLVSPASDGDFDFRMSAADGRTVWLHNVVSERVLDGVSVLGGFLFDVTERKQVEAMLKEKLDIIRSQQAAIQKLSTPIIEVWEGVLTMPVLGIVDEPRAEQMMSVVLEAVSRKSSRYTIIDLTGVDHVDTTTADYLMRIVRAVQLLGAQAIIAGIRPEVAQTIVAIGADLSSIITLANLREALLLCMRDGGNRGEAERGSRFVRGSR